jgi:nucleotide-binding universal stress UspA family protein
VKKHILLTISDDASALHAVRFAAGYFSHTEDLHLVLLYIAPNPKSGLPESEILYSYDTLSQRTALATEQAQTALAKAKDLLLLKNFPASRIHKKITFRQLGTAGDIIQESISGMYDAVALGRRGLSRLEEFILGSVSKEIFSKPLEIPLWICRRQEQVNPHLLLCVDSSPSSLRCADHVGFMLRDEIRHHITVLHVASPGTAASTDRIMKETRQVLEENGIAPERIKTKVLESKSVAEAILNEAREGAYGVVAAGRRTPKQGGSSAMTGSVSSVLLKSLDFTTFWISA